MSKRKFDRKTLKYYARMAAEAYVNDPVHSYATKDEKIRKKYISHDAYFLNTTAATATL